jgi:hypothetical protein
MKSIPSFLKIAPVVFLGTVALALIACSGVFAHDDSMPGNAQIPPHARDTMRAFHEDWPAPIRARTWT